MPVDPVPAPLPQLLFGEDRSAELRDPNAYGDQMARVLTALDAYDALGERNRFRAKTCTIVLRDLVLTANACTPVRVAIGSAEACNLMIPLSGRSVTTHEHRVYEWQGGDSAMYFPAAGRGGSSATRSVLTIRLDPGRLQRTVRFMAGHDAAAIGLDRPQLVPLQPGGVPLLAPLRRIGQMIDDCGGQPALLEALNLDDVIYRWMGMAFSPDLLAAGDPRDAAGRSPGRNRSDLDRACDFALSRLDTGVALTDLEQIAGLSRRGLQYAFLRRFGMTPTSWIRQQRLFRARDRLQCPDPGDSVTSIALACGFGKPSTFARHYREAFGESPSVTLARARKHP